LTAVALASVVTAHAKRLSMWVGRSSNRQAANAWIPAIMHEAAFLFYCWRLWTRWEHRLLRESDFNAVLSLLKKLLSFVLLCSSHQWPVWIPAL